MQMLAAVVMVLGISGVGRPDASGFRAPVGERVPPPVKTVKTEADLTKAIEITLARGDYEDALAYLEEFAAVHPRSATVSRLRVRVLVTAGKTSAALAEYDRLGSLVKGEDTGLLREVALAFIRQAFDDDDERVRRSACEAVGIAGDRRLSPALRRALKDRNWSVRWKAAEALGRVGDSASVAALRDAARDADPFVRWSAAEALGRVGNPSSVPVLTSALKDESRSVRMAAAWALGEIGDRTPIRELQQALRDSEGAVRLAAAQALIKLGDRSAIPQPNERRRGPRARGRSQDDGRPEAGARGLQRRRALPRRRRPHPHPRREAGAGSREPVVGSR